MPETTVKIPIQPVGDRIIIQPDPADEVTKGGLIIPDNAKERPQSGTVLCVGEGRGIENETIALLTQIKKALRWILKALACSDKTIDDLIPINEKVIVKYEPGMRVLYGRYAGTEIQYKEVKYLIMRFSDIAAIVEE